MKPPSRVPRARDYIRLLMNSWIVIVCATALSVGTGWLVRQNKDPVYFATTRIFVITPGTPEEPDVYYGSLSAMSRTVTYQRLARSFQVTTRTIDQLKLHKTPHDLANDITVGVEESAVMEIQVTGSSADVARDTANAITLNMIQVSHELATLDTASPDLVPVDLATSAYGKRSSLYRYLVLGGGLGFALSTVLVLAIGLMRDQVLDRKQVGHVVDETLSEGRT